jgi:outer membrane receptor for ferrienterochelin and colicin
VELAYRDMTVPFFDQPSGTATLVVRETDWEEYLGRAYLYWTPHRWLALRAEYLYEKSEREQRALFNIKEVKTNSFPLGINFFHPSGLSAFFGATYYDQEGTFQREIAGPTPAPFEEGKDDFWLVDAAINYRLPKRYGFITVGATNLFDKEFQYADIDIQNPRIQPDRFIFAKVTLAIP